MFGGLYIVPLYALIQERSRTPAYRSRIIAASNILNAFFLVASAGVALGLLKTGLSIPQLFVTIGAMNAVVARFIYLLVPEFLMRFLAWVIVRMAYRVRTEGLANIPSEGGAVLVCNHVSYADAMVIAGFVRKACIRFVMDHRIFRIPVLSFIFRTMRTIPHRAGARGPGAEGEGVRGRARGTGGGRARVHLPRRPRLTQDGEIRPLQPGIARDPRRHIRCRWCRSRCAGCGATSSRGPSTAARCAWLGLWAPIELVAGAALPPADATPDRLQRDVSGAARRSPGVKAPERTSGRTSDERSTRLDLRLGARGAIATPQLRAALAIAGAVPDGAAWRRFLTVLTLALGAVLFAVGVVYFIAFNWHDLSRFFKLALVEGALVVAVATALIAGLDSIAGRAALVAAAIITGGLLALVGQIYRDRCRYVRVVRRA